MTAIMQPADVDFNNRIKVAIHRKASALMRAKVQAQLYEQLPQLRRSPRTAGAGAGQSPTCIPNAATVGLRDSPASGCISSRLRSRASPEGVPTVQPIRQKVKIKVSYDIQSVFQSARECVTYSVSGGRRE
eukprot:GHVU01124430.1.p2 GENE.GHVU01124430.1~~GHVU01124430.1.p2  ORF type:complete len:131 (-),score=16.52 GHVU01124430.1:289-681(-)